MIHKCHQKAYLIIHPSNFLVRPRVMHTLSELEELEARVVEAGNNLENILLKVLKLANKVVFDLIQATKGDLHDDRTNQTTVKLGFLMWPVASNFIYSPQRMLPLTCKSAKLSKLLLHNG